VDEATRSTVDQRQSRADQRVLRSAEADFLRKRDTQDHARLAVIGEALPSGAVDQRIEVGHSPQHLAGDGDGQSEIRGREAFRCPGGRVQRPASTKHCIQHLQRGAPRR
jgi:hypothetical protein